MNPRKALLTSANYFLDIIYAILDINVISRKEGNMLKKVFGIILIAFIVAAGFWYYKANVEGITPIGKILSNPGQYEEKIITIKGAVTERVSFMFIKYFKIKDRTGEIMVITERPLPSVGTKIKVNGTVHDAFSIGSDQFLVFIEKNSGVSE